MRTTHAERTIDDLLQLKRLKMLSPNPEYQRGAVWSRPQQMRLVDSVMRGYPIPLLYLHHIQQPVAGAVWEAFEIIDGQQRIDAIFQFSENQFKLFDPVADEAKAQFPRFIQKQPCPWAGKPFEQLEKPEQLQFRNTKISVVMIESDSIDSRDEARDLFILLLAGMRLNAQEKRDVWPGAFTELILEIGGKPEIERYPGHGFFNHVVRPSKKNRGDCRQLAAKMLMLLTAQRESGDKRLCGIDRQSFDDFYYKHWSCDRQSAESARFQQIFDVPWHSFDVGDRLIHWRASRTALPHCRRNLTEKSASLSADDMIRIFQTPSPTDISLTRN